jgi:predicted regulator of Ras-like GTPase activity (Roadblock/LC7/MglB family)
MKLFKLMKGIFLRSAETPVPVDELPKETYAEAPAAAELPEAPPVIAEYAEPAPVAAPAHTPEPAYHTSAPAATVDVNNAEIALPLPTLVASFPVELQQRVITEHVGQTIITFPLAKVLPQLAQGAVRVTFGEIRNCAPEAFSDDADRDHMLVTLPLNEFVSRLRPAMLNLRSRKQVQVPDEITSPFGARGHGLSLSETAPKPSLTLPPRGAQPAAPVPPAADVRTRGNVTSVRRPTVPGTPSTDFLPKTPPLPPRPAAPAAPASPTISGSSLPPGRVPASQPSASAASLPASPAAKPANGSNGNGNGNGNGHGVESRPVMVELSALLPAFPEAVRLEAAQLDLSGAKLALPGDLVEAGLKRGKVSFTWKQLRACLSPALPPSISAHDSVAIDLPLAVIAPMFLNRNRVLPGGHKQRVVVDEKIPNLFFGFPQPEAAPVMPSPQVAPAFPVPKPVETNYFVWDDEKEQAAPAEDAPAPAPVRPAPAPGTTFSSRKSTPNDVVLKATTLEGVYGALVALPDGLPVAARLDSSQNSDAIAALIPQMYSKLSGCTKELRMGELNNLNFTVGNVPWKIFRVNGIFFAAFGTAGQSLPTAQLAQLATELDYKKAQ